MEASSGPVELRRQMPRNRASERLWGQKHPQASEDHFPGAKGVQQIGVRGREWEVKIWSEQAENTASESACAGDERRAGNSRKGDS